MNKVVLVGRLTKDLELRYTQKGTAVASSTLAINRRFKNQNGENEADFINIVVWGPQGENAAKYVGKGSQVGISGRIQTRNYEAKDGTRRYITEVVAEEVEFLDSRKSSGDRSSGSYSANSGGGNYNNNSNNNFSPAQQDQNQNYGSVPMDDFQPLEDDDDDLPF
ncbi:MAG TPA: single-stranded DNA-binding protein [Eubacteriaceae bacterium]|nr:single-stranded DNA-binding protein [Eubacteriaceae bacterium]